MQFVPNRLYHIFNQGNNRQQIFYSDQNYLYFLKLLRRFVLPYCDIIAYCLMPNHFHFLVSTTEVSCEEKKSGVVEMQQLAFSFKTLLSSYTQAINKQQNWSGSLFRQKTKSVLVEDDSENYGLVAFNYIHQNPLKAKLVDKLEDWAFSSFRDYSGFRKGTLCNQNLAYQILPLIEESFYVDSLKMVDEGLLKNIE